MNDLQELLNIAGMTSAALESGKLAWIVRCKDCKHRNQHGECKEGYGYHIDNWFCADGKPKEG